MKKIINFLRTNRSVWLVLLIVTFFMSAPVSAHSLTMAEYSNDLDLSIKSQADSSTVQEEINYLSQEYIELKFMDGSNVRLHQDDLVSSVPDQLVTFDQLLQEYPVNNIQRLFSEKEDLISATRVALENDLDLDLPDLNLWFRMQVASGTDIDVLVEELNNLPEIEVAYQAPLPAPLPTGPGKVPGMTPSYQLLQDYLDPAPEGIDAFYAYANGGGSGANVIIADIEYSFTSTHEDLPTIPVIGGAMYHGFGDDHGTAVLGMLVGINNAFGITGIAHGAQAIFSSPCNDASCSIYNVADAINTARLSTIPGDVILLEQQARVCGTSLYGPVEYYSSIFDAILIATSSGRIVVEAAGNGGYNLDDPSCGGLFDRKVRDSGAIIVGAGAAPDAGIPDKDRSRLSFSSYGSRVDLQGWGELVVTTGYGDLFVDTGVNDEYTAVFNGTSSASPTVAGAAALLSSISIQAGTVLTPGKVREILVETGSPQQAYGGFPVSEHIGPRPDLFAALSANIEDNVGFYVPSMYRWYLKTNRIDGWTGVISMGWGGASELKPVVGDWDGDGVDTAGFYKPSQYKWLIKNDQLDGWAGVSSFNWGGASDLIPLAGDWDGDGDDTVGFFKESTGEWFLKDENTGGWSGFTKVIWGGAAGNIPIVGDWDGDGDDTIGFFVPSSNKWWLKNDLADGWAGVGGFSFGTVDPMEPVTGDWDGDGVDTVGAYVPAKWRWYLKDDQVSGWSNVSILKFGPTVSYEVIAGDWQ